MFAAGNFQPQLAVTFNQLAYKWQSARSAGQRHLVRHRNSTQTHQNARPSIILTTPVREYEVDDVHKVVKNTLSELGLEDLAEGIKVEEITTPHLTPDLLRFSHSIKESHVSCETFFENKTGFSASELQASIQGYRERHLQVSIPSFKSLPQYPLHHQTVRGFKTVRSDKAFGFGAEPEDVLPSRRILKAITSKARFDDPEKGTTKLKTLLHENSEIADKLKIAFAEGYSANTGEGGSQKGETAFMKKVSKFIVLCLSVYLGYQLFKLFLVQVADPQKFKILSINVGFQAVNPEDIHVTFSDVKGCDEAKEELQDVVEYLKNPEKYKDMGAKLPKGVLLVGPPGTGKTLLSRAVAGEAAVPFFQTSGSEFDEMYVGTGARKIRSLFEEAKNRAPCVIFIDEIDTVGAKRTSSTFHPYANQTVNQLLAEMDGFVSNTGVIVLGATNRSDNLDPALVRPGRFDVEVKVDVPDLKGRIDILNLYVQKIKVDEEVNVDIIARSTAGSTGADLENIVNQAALKAAKDGESLVTKDHLEFAMDKVLMGPEKKFKIPDEQCNWNTAYHEAGHTIVAHFTKDAIPMRKVTIMPRGQTLGHTSFVAEKDMYQQTRSQLLAAMDVAMGGRVAEELHQGPAKVTTGAAHDFNKATDIATGMVRHLGMSEKIGVRVFDGNKPKPSSEMAKAIDAEIKQILEESLDRARNILKSHKKELDALAEALVKYETLDKKDVELIMKGKKLKRPVVPTPKGSTGPSKSGTKINIGETGDPHFLSLKK